VLLTVDLGNTSLKLGIFDENKQVAFACFDHALDNYRSLILSFIFKASIREDDITKAILSCVVPASYDGIVLALESIVGSENIIDINPDKNYGINLAVPNPKEVGDDIIVMCSYAYHLHPQEQIVVSIGTCSVLCHISAEGNFLHCIIAPGFNKMAETLWKNAAQLPQFELSKKNTFLANNTIDAMNIGIYNGYIGMLAFLVAGMKKDIGKECYVMGCGGLGKMVAPYINFFNDYDPDFVTKGLNFIYQEYEHE